MKSAYLDLTHLTELQACQWCQEITITEAEEERAEEWAGKS